jgi:hypothetical protein
MRTCRAPGCEATHASHMFCCKRHWFALPKHYRDAIWGAYRGPGVFSNEYMQAAENADAFLGDRDAEDVGEVFS